MTGSTRRRLRLMTMMLATLTLGGCAWLWNDGQYGRAHRGSTPLVDFLYASGDVPAADAPVELQLPIRIGVSFLPGDQPANDGPTAVDREKVLQAIRENFRALPYVTEIVIVPDYYLSAKRGDGMMQIGQLSQLFKFDLFALVSYDQITDETMNKTSLTYLTIVGSFFVRGNRHETHTLLDLAVVDPRSHALVMRAGGTSSLAGDTAAIDIDRHERHQRSRGFEVAGEQLIQNLKLELTSFEARVRDGTAPVHVVHREKGKGGGALDPTLLTFLAMLSLRGVLVWHGRKSSASVRS